MCPIYGKNLMCDVATTYKPDFNLNLFIYTFLLRVGSKLGTALKLGLHAEFLLCEHNACCQ